MSNVELIASIYSGPDQDGIRGIAGPIDPGIVWNVEDVRDAGNMVIMLGRGGNVQVVHVWRCREGKVVEFRQYSDLSEVAG